MKEPDSEVSLPPQPISVDDYRNAPSGQGPMAYAWRDKPHRLVYDLVAEVERLRADNAALSDRIAADYQFGNPTVNRITGGRCCGKPHGCSIPGDRCLYFDHPWKRMARGEITMEECTSLMWPQNGGFLMPELDSSGHPRETGVDHERIARERRLRPTLAEIVTMLHEADGYLSLMHRYQQSPVPEDVRQEMLAASGRVRSLVALVERYGVQKSREGDHR
jgi:hypothetical protein